MILTLVVAACIIAYLVRSVQIEFKKLSFQYGNVINSSSPGIHIIDGEESLTFSNIKAYLNKIQVEFQSLIDSADNLWNLEAVKRFSKFSLTIESRRVEGTLAKFNQPVQRAKWRFKNCDPLKLFLFLISVEGFTVIDPFTPIEEHIRPPIVDFTSQDDRKTGTVLEVRHGNLPFPINHIDFLVFNTIVTDSLLFVSKSVCNDSVPLPSSSLSRWMPGLFVPGRAVLHFGIRVSGERDRGGAQGGCLVESFNYAANLNIPDVMNYAFNAQQFYPDLLNRLLQKYNVSDNS